MTKKERKLHNLNIKLDIISMILWFVSGVIDWDTLPIMLSGVWVVLMLILLIGRFIYAEFVLNW